MSFIRDLYIFFRLFVLLLFVRQRICAECERNIEEVEKEFYEVFKNELSNPFTGKLLELLKYQDLVIPHCKSLNDLLTDLPTDLQIEDLLNLQVPSDFLNNAEIAMKLFEEICDTIHLSSVPVFIFPVISNQHNLLPLYYVLSEVEIFMEKLTKLSEHMNRISVFQQFEKLNLGNTNAEGSSNQRGSVNKLCSAVAQNCFRAVVQFENELSWSTFPTVFNKFSNEEANEIVSNGKYLPWIKCSSQNLKFYITFFTSKLFFLLQAGDGDGSDAKLIALTNVET